MDIIDSVIEAYKKYDCPKNIDCENKHPEFWIQCVRTGLAEIEIDLTPNNIKKEFADLVFIGIDALNKMGYDVRTVLEERLETNSKKDLANRDMNFYREKEKKLTKHQY